MFLVLFFALKDVNREKASVAVEVVAVIMYTLFFYKKPTTRPQLQVS